MMVNFLHRSTSNPQWFIWPQFQVNGQEAKCWVAEEAVFYHLPNPKEGRRTTLMFDNVEEVEKIISEMNGQ